MCAFYFVSFHIFWKTFDTINFPPLLTYNSLKKQEISQFLSQLIYGFNVKTFSSVVLNVFAKHCYQATKGLETQGDPPILQ